MMITSEVVTSDADNPTGSVIERVAGVLAAGGLVVIPTETCYGLAARADEPEAIEKLLDVKGRDRTKAVAQFVSHPFDIGSLATLSNSARKLVKAFLPGPLTLVLPSRYDLPPPRVVDGRIGLRCSSSAFATQLLELTDFPVLATSANKSGQEQLIGVEEIGDELGNYVDLYVNAGTLDGPPSTVVDCSQEDLKVLREGAIKEPEILQVIRESNV